MAEEMLEERSRLKNEYKGRLHQIKNEQTRKWMRKNGKSHHLDFSDE